MTDSLEIAMALLRRDDIEGLRLAPLSLRGRLLDDRLRQSLSQRRVARDGTDDADHRERGG